MRYENGALNTSTPRFFDDYFMMNLLFCILLTMLYKSFSLLFYLIEVLYENFHVLFYSVYCMKTAFLLMQDIV